MALPSSNMSMLYPYGDFSNCIAILTLHQKSQRTGQPVIQRPTKARPTIDLNHEFQGWEGDANREIGVPREQWLTHQRPVVPLNLAAEQRPGQPAAMQPCSTLLQMIQQIVVRQAGRDRLSQRIGITRGDQQS